MTFDMNDAEPQGGGDLIPDGTFAKITMTVRRGGSDGDTEIDRGLLKASNAPGSDVKSLDCEFTVVEGPYARRKFWQMFTVRGGKLDDNGVSIGWKISKSTFRAMIDSALGLDPKDMSEATKTKRVLRGLADLSGVTFVGCVSVEPSTNPRYGDSNKLARVVVPTEPEWRRVLDGEVVPPVPSSRPRAKSAPAASVATPAWNPTPAPAAAPVWNSPAATPAKAPEIVAAAPPSSGPSWLNG